LSPGKPNNLQKVQLDEEIPHSDGDHKDSSDDRTVLGRHISVHILAEVYVGGTAQR